jgi:hypothetical protein
MLWCIAIYTTFARPARTKEALPGPDGLAESSQDELISIFRVIRAVM